jgi:hypothetical protein
VGWAGSLTPPPATVDTAGLLCALLASHALAAVVTGQPDDATAPMQTATDMAARFGE